MPSDASLPTLLYSVDVQGYHAPELTCYRMGSWTTTLPTWRNIAFTAAKDTALVAAKYGTFGIPKRTVVLGDLRFVIYC